jgi:hypothetical protein
MLKQKILKYVRKIANKAGVDIVGYEDPYRLHLYENLFDAATLARKPFYNIGAGAFQHPYWTSVDYDSDWYGKNRNIVHYDLLASEPLPIKDGAAKIVYTSHTIEHVTNEAVAHFFKDTFRALEPGGIFRITTGPDAETDYRAMVNGDDDWFYWDQLYDRSGDWKRILRAPATSAPLEERWLHHVATQLAPNSPDDGPKVTAAEIRQTLEEKGLEGTLNHFSSMVKFDPNRVGNHISWWTHGKIEQYLREAGFTNIYRSGHRQSVSPLMRRSNLFDSTHPQMSIYMEAIR